MYVLTAAELCSKARTQPSAPSLTASRARARARRELARVRLGLRSSRVRLLCKTVKLCVLSRDPSQTPLAADSRRLVLLSQLAIYRVCRYRGSVLTVIPFNQVRCGEKGPVPGMAPPLPPTSRPLTFLFPHHHFHHRPPLLLPLPLVPHLSLNSALSASLNGHSAPCFTTQPLLIDVCVYY